ncbi:hypothetical protein [Pseudomonas synxantha]|nr:hypothetical protein [Pseudomonas synxantha]
MACPSACWADAPFKGTRPCDEGACSRWSAQRSQYLGSATRPSGSKLPRHSGWHIVRFILSYKKPR